MDRAKMVDFLVGKITEEKEDAGKYMEAASWTTNSDIKSKLTKIANEELDHQACLVNLLAAMAKDGGVSV